MDVGKGRAQERELEGVHYHSHGRRHTISAFTNVEPILGVIDKIYPLTPALSLRERVYLLPLSFFIPLPVSPYKKRYDHHHIDDHAYRKKTIEMFTLLNMTWLFCTYWTGFT